MSQPSVSKKSFFSQLTWSRFFAYAALVIVTTLIIDLLFDGWSVFLNRWSLGFVLEKLAYGLVGGLVFGSWFSSGSQK